MPEEQEIDFGFRQYNTPKKRDSNPVSAGMKKQAKKHAWQYGRPFNEV